MILLDTNVISEPQRQAPNARVLEWIDAQALETLYLSAITVAELRAGIALMPAGSSLHATLALSRSQDLRLSTRGRERHDTAARKTRSV